MSCETDGCDGRLRFTKGGSARSPRMAATCPVCEERYELQHGQLRRLPADDAAPRRP